jgi:hypothetical protein
LIQQNPTLRRLGFISFSIATLLGILIILVRAWPNFESSMYGFIKYGYPGIPSLSCPVLMTTNDRQPVTIRIHNSLNKPYKLHVNAQFSAPVIVNIVIDNVELQPGETKTFSWEVGKENIDLHNFIFAYVYTSLSSEMRESTCGTMVLNLPFKGGPLIFYASLVFIVLAGGFGLWLWLRNSDVSDPAVSSQGWWMRLLALVILVGVVAGFLNWWFLGILTLFLTILTLSVFLIPRKI